MPKKFDLDRIPTHFRELITGYGFEDADLLNKAVAVREAKEWFAILFYDDAIEEYFAVDFKYFGPGESQFGIQRVNGWEIQNDDVGPFASINEFLCEKLSSRLF